MIRGREAMRAAMVAELDRHSIVTISIMVCGDDVVAVSIPNLGDYLRALALFDAGHGRSS